MSASNNAAVSEFSARDGLGRYLRQIRDYPLLSASEERCLAQRYAEEGCADARNRMINSHLRLVAKIAAGYRGYGLPPGELISAGNIGLMQAVDKFDVSKGFRLATYAMWWIRAAMQEYILQSWSIVRMGSTSQQKKLFFNLRRLKGRLQALEDGELSEENIETISGTLSVSRAEVVKMNRRMAGPDYSLNAPLREEGEGERQDWLIDESDDQETTLAARQETSYQRQLLGKAMGALTERERDIVVERRLAEQPLTLEQLGYRYGISRERVRQIEGIAMEKLMKNVGRAAPAADGERHRTRLSAGGQAQIRAA